MLDWGTVGLSVGVSFEGTSTDGLSVRASVWASVGLSVGASTVTVCRDVRLREPRASVSLNVSLSIDNVRRYVDAYVEASARLKLQSVGAFVGLSVEQYIGVPYLSESAHMNPASSAPSACTPHQVRVWEGGKGCAYH